MANPNRKMATMRRVSKVEPIEGADRIEAIHVDGWVVVDQKGLWHEDDLCVYFEVDTFLPTNDERYRFLAQFGEKTMTVRDNPTVGHVLRTRRMRGVYSQGLVMRPQDALPDTVPVYAYETMYERKACLDGICGVCEYHPDQSSLAAGFIGKYDPYVAPRTDAERVQNIDDDVFSLIKRTDSFTSVKVDGTSTTMVWDMRTNSFRAFSHNNEYDLTQGLGRTTYDTAQRQGLVEWCKEHPGTSIQSELCGPKINGNALGLKAHRLFVFSMWDMEARTYLDPYADELVARQCTPLMDHFDLLDFESRDRLIEWTNHLRGQVVSGRLDEGVVVHVMGKGDLDDREWDEVRNALGSTMQMKSVSNAFLLKKAKKG